MYIFGTDEIPLSLDGIKFTGEATLPLSESYAGNVTFLFVDGDKRSTEVLDDFKGVISVFDNVASGIISAQPEVSDGNIKLSFDLDAVILNNDYFDFSKYELVVASGQTDIKSYDLEQLASQQETKIILLMIHRKRIPKTQRMTQKLWMIMNMALKELLK